jgi:hypothetical protein
MKAALFLTCLIVIFLASCSSSFQSVEATSTIIPMEVTRIVQITTTPIPTATITPVPTLSEGDIARTEVAWEIGTPIVASEECYKTAQTQSDLNACAGTRLQELEIHMVKLFESLEVRYQRVSPEKLEKFRNLHVEWENLSKRECEFRSGLDSEGWAGSMAPLNYGECLRGKYEDRLREYQIQIFEWTR